MRLVQIENVRNLAIVFPSWYAELVRDATVAEFGHIVGIGRADIRRVAQVAESLPVVARDINHPFRLIDVLKFFLEVQRVAQMLLWDAQVAVEFRTIEAFHALEPVRVSVPLYEWRRKHLVRARKGVRYIQNAAQVMTCIDEGKLAQHRLESRDHLRNDERAVRRRSQHYQTSATRAVRLLIPHGLPPLWVILDKSLRYDATHRVSDNMDRRVRPKPAVDLCV